MVWEIGIQLYSTVYILSNDYFLFFLW